VTSPVRQIADELRARITGRVDVDASLAPFTTFRVGGPADILVEAESESDLAAVAALRDDQAIAIVGRGSNLLVADDGFRGIAVRLGRSFRTHDAIGETLDLGGAVYLPAAAKLTARLGLAGFEFAAEIPATFGGAVRMNAGAHGREIKDVLIDARVVDLRTGSARTVGVDELEYAYRHSSLRPDDLVVGGRIALTPGDGAEIGRRISGFLRWRREHQPAGRSAGSVFKNPEGDSAGRLIDSAGGKGMRVGGAVVSDVHANFVVADPGASATDVWTLVRTLQSLVRERHGVVLEPEVRFLGAFPDAGPDRGSEVNLQGPAPEPHA
jgi:UDP-N-acetylmuramate dehydrogenase